MQSQGTRRGIPDEHLIEDLRHVAGHQGTGSLTMRTYSQNGGAFHPSTFIRRFGTWSNALVRAGLAVVHFNSGIEASVALADMKCVAARLGRTTLTQAEYHQHGTWGREPFIRHFGSWMAALKAADLGPSRTWNLSDEDLFRNIERLWRTLGRQPYYGELEKPFSAYVAGTYEYRFGTWRKALDAFLAFMGSPPPMGGDHVVDGSPEVRATATGKRPPWTIDWRMRFQVMRRDDFRCLQCGASPTPGEELRVEHVPGNNGATDPVPADFRTLCRRCQAKQQPRPFVRFGARDRRKAAGAGKAPEVIRPLPAPVGPR